MKSFRFAFIACLTLITASGSRAAEIPAASKKQIESLIQKLGAETFKARKAAVNALLLFGEDAIPALERAVRDPDPEVSERAKKALSRIRATIAARTHRILDAEWRAIAGATLKTESESVKSDAWGYVTLRLLNKGITTYAVISTPDQGRAKVRVQQNAGLTDLVLPLVEKKSETYARALKGRITDPGGQPVSNATIFCSSIRTPGQGLIQPRFDSIALTDKQGAFILYPILNNEEEAEDKERGRLVPPNSHFEIIIRPPDQSGLFPWRGNPPNTETAQIALESATLPHVFKFENPQSGFLPKDEALRNIILEYEHQFSLDPRFIEKGGMLKAGTYNAQCKSAFYQPMKVTPDSPRELVFRFPTPTTYQGRIVQGVSGRPFPGAFVIAVSSIAHNNLALLTPRDWDEFEKLPPNTPLDHPELTPLHSFYGFKAITRSDTNGIFKLTPKASDKVYDLVFFARDHLPFKYRVLEMKENEDHRLEIDDVPLYPAAKALVEPVKTKERISVGHKWVLQKDNQPDWFKAFRGYLENSDMGFERLHWLKPGQKQPLFIPADLNVSLKFTTPYDSKWTAFMPEQVMRIKQGETYDLGQLNFIPSASISVTVLDPRGKPVEGIPVRPQLALTRSWRVAHNTDEKGQAYFYAPPDSSGLLGVVDFGKNRSERKKPNTKVPFEVGADNKLLNPCVIRLTDKQIKILLGDNPL